MHMHDYVSKQENKSNHFHIHRYAQTHTSTQMYMHSNTCACVVTYMNILQDVTLFIIVLVKKDGISGNYTKYMVSINE